MKARTNRNAGSTADGNAEVHLGYSVREAPIELQLQVWDLPPPLDPSGSSHGAFQRRRIR
eukprot:4418175-Pyramimonas_sp.AAC.1